MLDFSDFNSPAEFGHLVGMTDRALSKLGLWCCAQAAEGKLGPDDAGNVLEEFNTARRAASGDPRIPTTSHKVQVSKLARIIITGAQFGERGSKMLDTFCDLHLKKFIGMAYGTEVVYNGEYNGMVEVAREAVRRGKVLSRNEIIDLVTVHGA